MVFCFYLRQTGHVDFTLGDLISTYWPAILIVLGIKKLLSSRSGWWGAILVLIGFIFLSRNLDWIGWSIGQFMPYLIPIVIIVVGFRMIWKPRSRHQTPPSNDWKSYSSYPDNSTVPPAPPLHPDPTQSESQPDQSEGNSIPSHKKYYEQGKRHSKEHVEWWNHSDPNAQTRSGFIGDIYLGHDYWELKPMNISHFIGDTVLDLTKAQVPFGETKINISSFIGDVKVYVPNDYESVFRSYPVHLSAT